MGLNMQLLSESCLLKCYYEHFYEEKYSKLYSEYKVQCYDRMHACKFMWFLLKSRNKKKKDEKQGNKKESLAAWLSFRQQECKMTVCYLLLGHLIFTFGCTIKTEDLWFPCCPWQNEITQPYFIPLPLFAGAGVDYHL